MLNGMTGQHNHPGDYIRLDAPGPHLFDEDLRVHSRAGVSGRNKALEFIGKRRKRANEISKFDRLSRIEL
jgi:hypothetical protein